MRPAKGREQVRTPAGKTIPDHPGKRSHPYIATMIRGSIARVSLAEAEARPRQTHRKKSCAAIRWKAAPARSAFSAAAIPIHHVIYIIKENRTYDQLFGDIREGQRRSLAGHVRRGHHAQPAQAGAAVRHSRQLLRQRRGLRRRARVVHGGHHQRLHGEDLADQLSRQRAGLRLSKGTSAMRTP